VYRSQASAAVALALAGHPHEPVFTRNMRKALEIYERIKEEYPDSQEGQEAEKYIAKMKILLSK